MSFTSLHERVAQQATLRPDAVAVRCDGVSLTYRELDARAERLAQALRALAPVEGRLVAIALERSAELIVGLLAILKAGAGYLPLDPAYPAERLGFMLDDAQPAALLTTRALLPALPAGALPVCCIDDAGWQSAPAVPPVAATGSADALAYVIYTSGSTGRPKGCQVTHANVLRLFDSTAHWFGFGPDDAWSWFHSPAFDFSVWEIWGALLHGGRVVMVPRAHSRAPAEFLQLLARERVTMLSQTPSAFRGLIAADRDAGLPPDALALRCIVFGGEALPLAMLAPWIARHGDTQPRLVNMYGITETTVHVTYRPITAADLAAGRGSVIGVPLPDLELHLLDAALAPVDDGAIGEIHVGGAGVCRGYLARPELTAERFIDWTPPAGGAARRLYRSGDLARRLPDGDLEYLGRADHQVKIRGFRIETGEIEAALAAHAAVAACAVLARHDGAGGEARLVAYVVPAGAQDGAASHAALRAHLARRLPEHMLPAAFVTLEALPLTDNGKLDREHLPAPRHERPDLGVPYRAPANAAEQRLCDAFAATLGLERVGADDNFFDLGGSSLLALQAIEAVAAAGGTPPPVASFFGTPTPAALAVAADLAPVRPAPSSEPLPVRPELVEGRVPHPGLRQAQPERRAGTETGAQHSPTPISPPIALIAAAGRFPGADSIEAFWTLLHEGREGLRRFAPEELDPAVPPALRDDPAYVAARGVIDGIEDFDAAFFGMPQREAEVTDPQQRVFLELAWECLERAGHAPGRAGGAVGVFAGAGTPAYLQQHVLAHPEAIERVGALQVQLGNDKDYIATRTAYKLDLDGPAVNVNTACSTSLVAVAQAVDALRLGRCRMALAGAASVSAPPRSGYLHEPGSMLSADGHTRAFDADASGTVFCDGAAVVLLQRLDDALADGDPVLAVIRGAATTNDSGGKASFSAPSVEGQAAVIRAAHADAGIDARSIGYVEAHGTATPLGDPVEIEGLTRAFGAGAAPGSVRIGSVKSNVGHMVAAAGAAGLIKTALALEHGELPASLHHRRPNPRIDFGAGPFVVNDRRVPWPRGDAPRRAGVSSFGVGGTNAHVVLEEAPPRPPSPAADGPQLLLLSARTPTALGAMAARLADHLEARPGENLADVAHTLQRGRASFADRLAVVAATPADAVAALRAPDAAGRATGRVRAADPPLVWLFPGQGSQYAGMGRALHAADADFRAGFDAALAALQPALDVDLRALMFDGDAADLQPTAITQPATFCVEYALAQAWLARGARPAALVGHSVGEFACAVLAGVMTLADAARLVARRGALMQQQPPGAMLSVRLAWAELEPLLPDGLALAAENAPSVCVVAGPTPAIEAFEAALAARGTLARRLATSHAFHSPMMDGALAPFGEALRGVPLAAPRLPIASTLTGTWLRDDEAVDPTYWCRHLREPVRYAPALACARERHPDAVLLEIGPRGVLAGLARQQPGAQGTPLALPSVGERPEDELAQLLLAQGRLWTAGLELAAPAARPSQGRRRVRLPSYPFERKRCWLDAPAAPRPGAAPSVGSTNTLPTMPTSPNATLPEPQPVAATPAPARRDQLLARLCSLVEDVAGVAVDPATQAQTSFVELGLDSLSLTQAALQIRKTFRIELGFRQLMEQLRSPAALAAHLDATLPPEPAPAPAVAAAAPAAAVQPTPQPQTQPAAATVLPDAPAGTLQQLLQLMGQQLALLQAAAHAGGPAVAQAGVASPAATAAAATTPSAPAMPPAAAPAAASATPPADPPSQPLRYDVKQAFGAIARIHTAAPAGLTERQQARLAAFVRRYVERTPRSKAYTATHRPHLADPRVVNGFRPATKEIAYQIVVERSRGARLWDLDGNEYVDANNGFGMSLFGWQPAFVQTAVRAQLDAGYEIGPQHPLAGEVAERLCTLTGFDRAGLCNTGSEAVMAALRIARTVTGRSTVVLFTGSYHGTFDEVLVRAGRGGKGLPAAPGILPGAFGDVRVLDYGTPESLAWIREHADDLAAVLVEPVQSRRPDFQPREFLRELRGVTEQAGCCLIFDEVITGFRCHLGGTQALFGVKADLACYGKVIGGGFPIGVVAGRRAYMDALDGGAWQYGDDSMPTVGVTYFAGTFVRHPLALAAARASLAHLAEAGPELQTQLNVHTAALADELSAFCREAGAPLEIRHFASLWRITWLEDHPLQDLLFAMMRSRGVHILDNFPCFLTTAHRPEDIAVIKSAFKESVAELQEAEFLPRRAPAAVLADASRPPRPGARLGRDKDGRPTWFVPDPAAPGRYVRLADEAAS